MHMICPNPMPWNDVYTKLCMFAECHSCTPLKPPVPLILAGWAYSNDYEKMERWRQTIEWAKANGCEQITAAVKETDFYYAHNLSDYDSGPLGGPMYLEWNFESRIRPSDDELVVALDLLRSNWEQIVGDELGEVTYPHAFTGTKRRKLLVKALHSFTPSWGGWEFLASTSVRRDFTRFRESVNKAIKPHMVDHVEFILVSTKDELTK